MATKKSSNSKKVKENSVLLTSDGLKKLQDELDKLVNIRRPYVVNRIQRARDLGDLSENAEYDAARDEQSFVEGRIQELTEVLRHVKVIDSGATKANFVVIGSTVIVDADGDQDEFTIVGSLEADPMNGKISNESPVGKALLGAKVGEIVEVSTSIVKTLYKVIALK